MEIIELEEKPESLKIVVDSNEESLFYLLKDYLEKQSDVDIVGVYKEHHLIDKTEFIFKVKKGDPKKVLNKYLDEIKKYLNQLKV
jgi:DNA-directed RNA polymerase subunit L